MKLYVASHSQDEAKAVAKLLEDAGLSIQARWLGEDMSKSAGLGDPQRLQIADDDVDDIRQADGLVVLASPRRIPGGKFVEVGVAIGLDKPVYLIGHRENMLMWHSAVRQFNSAEDLIRYLTLAPHPPHPVLGGLTSA